MKILNYGSMNIDRVYSVAHTVMPGETILAEGMTVYCGGKGLNQSIAIAKAGGDIYHAGVLGEDGDLLLEALTRHRVDTRYVRRVAGASSHTVIQVDGQGQNCIIVCPGENVRVTDGDIDAVLDGFAAGDMLVLQNELDNTARIMREAAKRGLVPVFNPSPVNQLLAAYPLECVRWFIMNEIEGAAITGETEPAKILSVMAQRYPDASVVLTLGAQGAHCVHGGRAYFQPAFPVKAVDTTAAGDTFTGYLVTGLSQREALPVILERAARASSITVGRKGAADSIPTREELDR
ncbi:MAG: ribokinase [Clostridiales bacterium]|nr:ribokinase [Clostridiales bacterium]